MWIVVRGGLLWLGSRVILASDEREVRVFFAARHVVRCEHTMWY